MSDEFDSIGSISIAGDRPDGTRYNLFNAALEAVDNRLAFESFFTETANLTEESAQNLTDEIFKSNNKDYCKVKDLMEALQECDDEDEFKLYVLRDELDITNKVYQKQIVKALKGTKTSKWDVFISHCTKDDSHDVFKSVMAFMQGNGCVVFNPTIHLTHYEETNTASMQDAVQRSNIVIAAMSHEFFKSTYCESEIEAAKESNIKVIPVYSGDDHAAKQVDKWVKEFRNHHVFGYVFKENARDVLNKQNSSSTTATLKYLAKQCKEENEDD